MPAWFRFVMLLKWIPRWITPKWFLGYQILIYLLVTVFSPALKKQYNLIARSPFCWMIGWFCITIVFEKTPLSSRSTPHRLSGSSYKKVNLVSVSPVPRFLHPLGFFKANILPSNPSSVFNVIVIEVDVQTKLTRTFTT